MVSAEDTSADELVVGLEAFLQLVAGAEHHKDFSFSNMLAGLREILTATSLFNQMDLYGHSMGRLTIVELSLLVQDLQLSFTTTQLRALWQLVTTVSRTIIAGIWVAFFPECQH